MGGGDREGRGVLQSSCSSELLLEQLENPNTALISIICFQWGNLASYKTKLELKFSKIEEEKRTLKYIIAFREKRTTKRDNFNIKQVDSPVYWNILFTTYANVTFILEFIYIFRFCFIYHLYIYLPLVDFKSPNFLRDSMAQRVREWVKKIRPPTVQILAPQVPRFVTFVNLISTYLIFLIRETAQESSYWLLALTVSVNYNELILLSYIHFHISLWLNNVEWHSSIISSTGRTICWGHKFRAVTLPRGSDLTPRKQALSTILFVRKLQLKQGIAQYQGTLLNVAALDLYSGLPGSTVPDWLPDFVSQGNLG